MESIQIYLHSANADKFFNNSISDCEFLLPPIEIPDGFHIYLSVQSVSIPYSFYNVNSNTNLLSYTVNGATSNLTITNGNYNITQLISFLTANMTGFTITYNSITNKLIFTHSTYNFTINSTSTCLSIIGFNALSTYASTSLTLTSSNCINIQTVKRINIASNLITYNINKANINNYSILCSIPINKPPFSVIEYSNVNHFRTNLFINNISNVKLRLLDENGTLLDLNGCHFCITLQLDVEPFN
jgi:hypothetical protein